MVICSIRGAQFPSSSWLPRAMSVPTPLVHWFIGTLVTVGLFLIICFFELLSLDFVLDLVFFVDLFTMLSSGF
ncbi:unnamed protein product, partial [Dracunculus medinensis]|uniref:NADH:ubiquinone reductase (H(+)-translocating) n=1 Tax=Dracunculus medinensis TaxID=318479 RepID=A0A0N4US56_DRAME